MISDDDKRPLADVLRIYQAAVGALHPSLVASWPLLNGWDLVCSRFKGWDIFVIKDAGFAAMCRADGVADVPQSAVGAEDITASNREEVRERLERHFNISARDVIFMWPPDSDWRPEIAPMLARHEAAMGISPMKIFLSHKGCNKPFVREFADTLSLLGFSPWLDEDAMSAGTHLERGLLDGFEKSCAAVFFVTPDFKDENYLATEVDYALHEKRKKGDRFSIITLVFSSSDAKGTVPKLLQQYVWKEPASDLAALQEIIKALPVAVRNVRWRSAP